MASAPDGIVLKRHRDLDGRAWHPFLRRGLVALVALVLLLALLDAFGQSPSTTKAQASPATLEVNAPTAVRGGLLFQARFTIHAHAELKDAMLVLGRGWIDGLTMNTMEPGALNEASRNGRLSLDLGHLPAGATHVLYIDYQVNPTTVSSRTLSVELDDGTQRILTLSRHLRILP
ncbi:MAG: hypothetical protein QOG06_360 [Gaiellaceae bacterium]|nr:hypothetical protein [Gaiellaceae bacterium]